MAEKTISTRQKQKYDTSTNWTTNNIVLLAGEIGIESDTNKFKVGNGTSTWDELDYAGGGDLILYSTTGQNTDGAMTQKAVSDALPQAVTVTLTGSQNFNDIVITNEQFNLLLSNPENYLIVEMTSSNLTVSLKYRRSQYTSMSVEGASQEMLIFECVNSTSLSFAPYAQRIDSLTVIKQTQNGESVIVVTDDTLDFTTFVPNNRTINGKSLANNITLTATDVGALPDTTEIPSTLADLTDDSTHRTVTDTEKSTWNAKSDFSGSYNDLTNKPTIPTINVDGQPQSTLNFDSDPQTQIDNIVNNTTLIQNNNGGFSAGYNAVIDSSSYGGGAIGRDSYARSGGAIGYESYTTSGGAVGVGAHSEGGGAMGQDAYATQGGAIGKHAITSTGFAGGLSAQTVDSNGDGIDAIQLGTGTNNNSKTLQIYDDNIYDANTHTLNSTNANITTLNTVNITINGSNIINHGSNSNGDYIQFYNGTQICIGTVTSEGTKTYASPFTANPVIVCGIINSSASNQISYRTMSAYNITSTNFHAQLTGSTAKTYIAIGKYK